MAQRAAASPTVRSMSEPEVVEPVVPGSAAWWVNRHGLQARRRPRASGLTIERITTTALAIVDTEGLEALTVRRLGDELATGSASLYRHVASRDELLVLLVDHVLGEVRLPASDLTGREKVEGLATELRRVLTDHVDLLPALTASPLLGPNAMGGVEAGLTYLLEAGFEPQVAVPAHLALIDFVLGTVFFDTSRAGRAAADGVTEADLVAAGVSGFPVLRATHNKVQSPLADDVFAFGLAVFLDGLEQRQRSLKRER